MTLNSTVVTDLQCGKENPKCNFDATEKSSIHMKPCIHHTSIDLTLNNVRY